MDTSKIKENMMVHAKGSGSIQVGIVDHMDGEKYIKLNKRDSPDGQHRWVPVDWVESVDDNVVYLNKTQDEFMAGAINQKPGS